MPQCQFHVFYYFCVSENLHKKYSRNWTKQKPEVQIFTGASRTPKRRQSQARGRPHHQGARPGPGPRRPMVWAPWSTSDAAPSPIKIPQREKPKHLITFPENTSRSATVVDPRSRASRSSSQHPAREGNRHQRSSSSSCLPPER
jgi:hypothetical protein